MFGCVQNDSVGMYGLVRKNWMVGTLVAFHDHNRILEHGSFEWNHHQRLGDAAQSHSYWIVAGILGLSSDNFSLRFSH